MPRFSIIQPGSIEISETEGVKDSRPTSSLLEFGATRIVIDTEHPGEDGREYHASLTRLGLDPSDVDWVIFTHLHPDHFGHKHFFPGAIFVFHKDERLGFYFRDDRKLVLNGSALLDPDPSVPICLEYAGGNPNLRDLGSRIYIRHAPGHTRGSTMIFACIDGLVHAWVGDTFLNEKYFREWKPPGSSWDQDRVYPHMEYVRAHADIVIPGHGPPFRTTA